MITRLVLGAVALGITNFSSGCGIESATIDNKPAVSGTIAPEFLKAQWDGLSPIERLKKLLDKDNPIFEGFNHQQETITALAQAYCQQTKCNLSANEMAEAVHYVDKDTFVEKLMSEDPTHKFDLAELNNDEMLFTGFTTMSGEIYINEEEQERYIEFVSAKPDIEKLIGDNDIRTLEIISGVAHEFTHQNIVNTSEEPVSFKGFSIRLPEKQDIINFHTLDKFVLIGENSDGTTYSFKGGSEAIVDLATLIIVRRLIGPYYISNSIYGQGVNLVDKLNSMANISDDEFLQYVSGELPPENLFIRWGAFKRSQGKSDLLEGIIAFGMVGSIVQEGTSFQFAEDTINSRLKLTDR